MYRSRYRQTAGLRDYLVPFFIIICIGVIAVLLFKLWNVIFSQEANQPVYMHIVSGSAEMKSWGMENVVELSSDAAIVEGDEIMTSQDAKIIVEFFDGTIMRMDGNTDVVFEEFDAESSTPALKLILVNGNIWFNKIYKDTGATQVEVNMGTLIVYSSGASIFELENSLDKSIRVRTGEGVTVDILTEDKETVVANEAIGVGQEIVFTNDVFSRYWQHQSPNVLSAFSDVLKETAWFKWNDTEDSAPTQFVKNESGSFVTVEPQVIAGETATPTDSVEQDTPVAEETAEPETTVDLGALTTPKLTAVSGGNITNADGFYVVSGNPAVITGTVFGADKVVVNGYTLQKFKSGDSTWTYYANVDYSYMKVGENIYEIYAIGADGKQSEKFIVKVLYNPPAVVEPTPEPPEPPTDTVPPAPGDEAVEE